MYILIDTTNPIFVKIGDITYPTYTIGIVEEEENGKIGFFDAFTLKTIVDPIPWDQWKVSTDLEDNGVLIDTYETCRDIFREIVFP